MQLISKKNTKNNENWSSIIQFQEFVRNNQESSEFFLEKSNPINLTLIVIPKYLAYKDSIKIEMKNEFDKNYWNSDMG